MRVLIDLPSYKDPVNYIIKSITRLSHAIPGCMTRSLSFVNIICVIKCSMNNRKKNLLSFILIYFHHVAITEIWTIFKLFAGGLISAISSHQMHDIRTYEWGGGGRNDLICGFSTAETYLKLWSTKINMVSAVTITHWVFHYWRGNSFPLHAVI